MKNVLLVEDHAAFRQALAYIFKSRTPLERDTQAGTLTEGRWCVGVLDGEIDVAVLELNLPDGDGLHLIEELREEEPDIPVLVLTRTWDRERHMQALEAGAEVVLTKDVSLEEILTTVRGLGAN